ncbi:hypothetical protein P9209_01990 [Prescottella defluvii]|nr:hypothetical protein P9209_01990 [Prescottella defluvii]
MSLGPNGIQVDADGSDADVDELRAYLHDLSAGYVVEVRPSGPSSGRSRHVVPRVPASCSRRCRGERDAPSHG